MKKNQPIEDFKVAKDPFSLVIFGASGSLAKLKLFPALYELAAEKRMPEHYSIVGYGRTKLTQKQFKERFEASVREAIEYVDEDALSAILKHVHYHAGNYDQESDFKALKEKIAELENNENTVRMAYFSVPPSAFPPIFDTLNKVNFNTRKSKLRLVIEKPFGYDLKSAKKLKKMIEKNFKEEQIYMLDHYLGKEAVSNLMSLRYANAIITNLMNKKFVSNIQIVAMEDRDIEGRANYFDNVGILRDMVQSHLLQILAYLTMFAPLEPNAKEITKEKKRVLRSIQLDPNSVVRGQYMGYAGKDGVPKASQTETFAALKLCLKHPLWEGVPIYLKSGKALKQKWTAVVIEFKPRRAQRDHGELKPNRLVIQLQPTEKIEFHMLTKLGGQHFAFHEMTTGRPIYCSGDCLTEHGRLFLDVIDGSKELFLIFDEIFAAWRVIDPVVQHCEQQACKPHAYKKGGLGPKAADELLKKDGFEWFYSF